jgi:hypothetical protein
MEVLIVVASNRFSIVSIFFDDRNLNKNPNLTHPWYQLQPHLILPHAFFTEKEVRW